MRINCTKPVDRLSMDAAILVYLEQVVAPNLVFQMPEEKKVSIEDKNAKESITPVHQVYEIFRLQHQQQQHEKKQKEQPKKIFSGIIESTSTPSILAGNNAYDLLECRRGDEYLLYSYDKLGCHSVLGKDVSPSSYGGRITSGDFGRKA